MTNASAGSGTRHRGDPDASRPTESGDPASTTRRESGDTVHRETEERKDGATPDPPGDPKG